MSWPDDANYSKKPRYSAETGSRLLVTKDLDLENQRSEQVKLSQELERIRRERDEATQKLSTETLRCKSLEVDLGQCRKERLSEKNLRENLEVERQNMTQRCKVVEQERKDLLQRLDDLATKQSHDDQRKKIMSLEGKIRSLQNENATLRSQPERPPSRTSSIPVPKPRVPRSSSETRNSRSDEELKTCRAELAEEKARSKRLEAQKRQADENALNLENEKTAAARKAQSIQTNLEETLQEVREELDIHRLERQSSSQGGLDKSTFDKLSRELAGLHEQLQAAKSDKQDLERRLARKTTQCDTMQEKLDDLMFTSNDDSTLRQELEDAREDARRAKQQFTRLKQDMEDSTGRRESHLQVRYDLQDRDRRIRDLEDRLQRRESTAAAMEANEDRIMKLFEERESLKDALSQAEVKTRYAQSQLQFRQQEFHYAQTQINELEAALNKARLLQGQQNDLYAEVVKSATLAEKRREEVEQELLELREEYADRSTVEEAAQRNKQWALALDRVAELEHELGGKGDEASTPKAGHTSLPPMLAFSDQADMDAVASLFVSLQRIREERDTLRGSVEFLGFELQAKEKAVEQRLDAERQRSLQLLRSAEEDLANLRFELSTVEVRMQDTKPKTSKTLDESRAVSKKNQATAMAAIVALQHLDSLYESELSFSEATNAALEAELQLERQASSELPQLKAGLEERDKTIADLQQRCSKVNHELFEKTQSLREIRIQLTTLQDTHEKLSGNSEEEHARYRVLDQAYSAQSIAYQRLEETHQILREELYEARGEADQLRNDHFATLATESPDAQSALQAHIEELDARIIRRNEQIGTQQNDIRRLDMNLRIAETTVDELRVELSEIRAQNVSLEDDATTVRNERNHAQKELDAARTELDAIRTSLESNESSLRELEENCQQALATLVGLIATSVTNTRLLKVNSKAPRLYLHQEDASVGKGADQVDPDEFDNSKRDIAKPTTPCRRDSVLQQSVTDKALQEALCRGDALAEQLRRSTELARAEVEERMSQLEEQIDKLTSEVETLEERLAESQDNIGSLLKQNGELDEQLGDLLSKATITSKEHTAEVEELKADRLNAVEELNKVHQASNAERTKLVAEYEALKLEHQSVLQTAEELRSSESQIQDLQGQVQLLQEQIAQNRGELREKIAENQELSIAANNLLELQVTLREQALALQAAESGRVSAEVDLVKAQADVGLLRSSLGEKSDALANCQQDLAKARNQLQVIDQLRSQKLILEKMVFKLETELQEAQQAASAAASSTVRDADVNIRVVQLETMLANLREENEELERVLAVKTKEIDDNDDRHIDLIRERKKLMLKVDSLSRKLRNLQKQLDTLTGAASAEPIDHGEVEIMPASSNRSAFTPESQLARRASLDKRRISDNLVSQPSNGSRRSAASLPPNSMEETIAKTTPKPLSSSAPLVPGSSVTPGTNGLPGVSFNSNPRAPHTPNQPVSTPPAQSSSSRKRRMPEDFDPTPTEQMPAMPVLSTTPARLRKNLPSSRNGFTPSRSRKNSASTADKELANAAAAAVASLQLSGTLKAEPTFAALPAKLSQPSASLPSINLAGNVAVASSKVKPVADITNTGKLYRGSAMPSLFQEDMKPVTAPTGARPRSGWLNRTNRTGATKPEGASRPPTTSSRRQVPALSASPKLGDGFLPRRQYGGN